MTTEIARLQYIHGLDCEPVYWDKPKLVSIFQIAIGRATWRAYFKLIEASL